MIVDCDTCRAPAGACTDCVMTVLLATGAGSGGPSHPVDLDPAEQAALGSLAQAGLVPPLRLVRPVDVRDEGPESTGSGGWIAV